LLLVSVFAVGTAACGSRSGATPAAISVPPTAGTSVFTTSFPLTENPLSDTGKWVNGKAIGLDWNDAQSVPNEAYASMLSGGASRYNDSIAHLSTAVMTFPPNQYAQGTVYRAAGYNPSPSKHEVELHLRFQTTAHNARGYEIMWGITGYLAIVRWNGALGDYTGILDTGDPGIGAPADGDVLRVEISGTTLTVFKNGKSVAQVKVDSIPGTVWAAGQPGMGFWPVDSSTPKNYGWKSYEAGTL
jgi:hypothetical protein